MMLAGVCLRQDTETKVPGLTEQHRIRQKEEEPSGLTSVYMPESECAAPGLNTLEPACVTAHCGVSDVHHTPTSLIKTETDLGSTHPGEFIKTESLNGTQLGYVTHLHPDQIKTETVDGGDIKVEHISDFHDIQYVSFKFDQIKCESSESLVSDFKTDVMTGSAVGHKDQIESGKCTGEPNRNCRNEEINHLLTQCEDLSHYFDMSNENKQCRIVQESTNSEKKHINCQGAKSIVEPMIINSSNNPTFLNVYQKTINRNEGEKIYQCSQCEKCFSLKSALNRHEMTHTGEKPYTCTQCGKCFSQKSSLNCHMMIHTGEKPYKCTECGKCFSRFTVLNYHKMIHSGQKLYKCTPCGKCFSRKSALSRHKMIHTGEKPYKCDKCKKSFTAKSSLNTHLIIHTGDKPHKCIQCGKCFSRKSVLNDHKVIHSGEKPYNCIQCGKSFSTLSILNNHRRIHTGEKPYKCIQCGKCFSQSHHLNRHLKVHKVEKPFVCT